MYVREPARAGLTRGHHRRVLPNALEVRIDPEFAAAGRRVRPGYRPDRPLPRGAVRRVLRIAWADDKRVRALFDAAARRDDQPGRARLRAG